MKEPILEPFLRRFRLSRVLMEIKHSPGCHLLDVGCGFNHKFLSAIEPYIDSGIGIDFKVPVVSTSKIRTIQATIDKTLPFGDDHFDIVTMLAVLEHLAHPVHICSEIARVLKPGGKLVLTVPGKRAKPVLEFLSYRLGIVDPSEIKDHKKYYDLPELKNLIR